jgi:PEP-CTERM motif
MIKHIKLKVTRIILLFLILGPVSANAATMIATNISVGPGDTLYAYKNNSLLDTGYVTIGYFIAGITQDQIDTVTELQSVLATPTNFISVSSVVPGVATNGIGNGYADGALVNIGQITVGNALLGRTIYSIVTNQSSLAAFASGSGVNNQVALVNIGLIKDDVPDTQAYSANPQSPATAVIGSFDSILINDDSNALGNGTYGTLKMDAVPEPSTVLLAAFGVLGLLRRRRN